jgi:hypothetical protein
MRHDGPRRPRKRVRRLEEFGRNRDQPLTGVRRPYFAGLHSNQSVHTWEFP